MDTFSDPRSLMILPDDILLLSLSFMPGMERVKLSRVCYRMSCLVDQLLAGVKELDYEKWFGSKLVKYNSNVFSKLFNLQTFHAKQYNRLFCKRIARVLAKNCPNLRDMQCHTRITQAYAKMMHETGSLKLQVLRLNGKEWDIQFVKQLLQSYPSTVKVFLENADGTDDFLHYLGDAADVIKSETTDFQIKDKYDDPMLMQKLTLILTCSNIRVLYMNCMIGRQTLQSILNSLPELLQVSFPMDIHDFDLLTCAKQQWTSVSHSLSCSETENPEEQHCRSLMQFIRQRQDALHFFGVWLAAAFADNVDLRNFIFCNCQNMTGFEMEDGITLTYSPKKRKLCLKDMSWESLQPILRLYPETKSIEIKITSATARRASRSFAAKWKEEIAAFAATKKSYAVRSEIIMK